MTSPGGPSGISRPPNSITGNDGSTRAMAQRTQDAVVKQKSDELKASGWGSGSGSLFGTILGGFGNVLSAITGTVNNSYIRDMPIINDHTTEIKELKDSYRQLILQGEALVFTTPGTYYPSEGIVSIDLILIGAGGGGGAGKWDLIPSRRYGASGGAGGGEVTATIPAHLLPASVPITIYQQGIGGSSSEASGFGGGNVMFGSYLLAGGGQGGRGADGNSHALAVGGSGLIAGGAGGQGGFEPTVPNGGWSNYPGELRGGGGGGGGAPYGLGGTGGASPGGPAGQPGTAPADIIATGGGGGGAGIPDGIVTGGAGASPGGGGGGGFGGGSAGSNGNGGNGGFGRLYILERKF